MIRMPRDSDASGFRGIMAGVGLYISSLVAAWLGATGEPAMPLPLITCGNVDCGVIVSGTSQVVHNQTRDLLLSCKAGGGLVLGASNAVQVEAAIENDQAMVEAWKAYGQY